ncbi:MAG: VWA domain-containing protein, partial [Thiotrichales bacterium]
VITAFSMSAQAATSVSWVSPADGTVFPVGAMVMPEGQASATGTTGAGLDLALVLDSSGSMTQLETVGAITQSRALWQKDAAIALVNSLPTTAVSVAVIEFDSNANLVRQLSPLLSEKAQVIAAINSVDASGGTTIGTGIDVATTELTGANHTVGRSQQMIVFSDGSTFGNPSVNAANAVAAGVDNVHSVALPGASISTMQGIASSGNGTFFDASTANGIQDLIDLFSGLGGNLVDIDHVDITMPDGTFVGSVPVDALGNFKTPAWLMELGANTFTATAFGTDGSSASAQLTLIGRDAVQTPEPGILGLLGLGLISIFGIRRRKQ